MGFKVIKDKPILWISVLLVTVFAGCSMQGTRTVVSPGAPGKVVFSDDFETSEPLSDGWSTGGTTGTANAILDPSNSENKVMEIDKTSTGALRISTGFDPAQNGEKVWLSYKFMVSEFTANPAFNLYFGADSGHDNHALNFVIGQKDNSYFLSHRTTNSGTGTHLSAITPNQWHQLEVQYEPAGINDTRFTVYLDGKLVAVMNEFYNDSGKLKEPIRDIKYIEFHGYSSSIAKLYIDDVLVAVPEN